MSKRMGMQKSNSATYLHMGKKSRELGSGSYGYGSGVGGAGYGSGVASYAAGTHQGTLGSYTATADYAGASSMVTNYKDMYGNNGRGGYDNNNCAAYGSNVGGGYDAGQAQSGYGSRSSSHGSSGLPGMGRSLSQQRIRPLAKPEADPRNWFLSSTRREYNLRGKTRKEVEAFQQTPALPMQMDSTAVPGDTQGPRKMSGLEAAFDETVRHIEDFYFRPYVRGDMSRSAQQQLGHSASMPRF